MNVLVFQNYPCEDAAVAGEAFQRLGHTLKVIDCYGGDPAPAFSEGDAALVLGGPMNVYDETDYPFLVWLTDWMARWIGEERPLLGLCLGAQLISKATGGKVMKNHTPEVGHFDVELTESGRRDPIFEGFPEKFGVVHWHGDTFSIPHHGVQLARSPLCENQALRVNNAVGLQFHLEIGRVKMGEWLTEYESDVVKNRIDSKAILEQFHQREAGYYETCHRLIENFVQGIRW